MLILKKFKTEKIFTAGINLISALKGKISFEILKLKLSAQCIALICQPVLIHTQFIFILVSE